MDTTVCLYETLGSVPSSIIDAVKLEDDPYINLAKESSLAFTTLLDFFIVNHFPARRCTTNSFVV